VAAAAGEKEWARTCWRGIELRHPPAWELTTATAGEAPGRLIFSDRRRERMTIQWRPLDREPDLARALERRKERGGDVREHAGLPEGWRGVSVPVEDGVVTHAWRFFSEHDMLAEAVMIWPGTCDAAWERAILGSVSYAPAASGDTWWEAMGLCAGIAPEHLLEGFTSQVGKVEWRFRERGGGVWMLQRLALPNYWLRGTLGAWLSAEVATEADVTAVKDAEWNGHAAVEVASLTRVALLKRLLGRRASRLDLAWLCPRENRVYRVRRVVRPQSGRAEFPCGVRVACCRPEFPVAAAARDAVPPRRAAGVDLLGAVPHVNRAAKIAPVAGGGALASVPLQTSRRIAWLRWLLPLSDARRVQLDALGASTLGLCDGRRSVEQIAERFAADNKLTFREAQLSVAPFIRMLYERGILAVVGGA